MGKIIQLEKSVYTKIAAGEVVEGPQSVVKELVENSIDAGSDKIEVRIIRGGKDYIEVSDNGTGIEKDDLLVSVLPHATSKITEASDLEAIKTLGFRGEALASIASVSKMTISSKVKSHDIGYEFSVEGGVTGEITESPLKNGTFITVKNLFFNTPARQKFLKSDKTVENQVTDTVTRLILANPEIAFKYYVDDKLVLESFGEDEKEALLSVYGFNTYVECFHVSNYKNGLNIRGFIGKHNFVKPNRTFQTLVLNGRYVNNQTISSAIMNAYSPYLMKRRYPFYVLYVDMPSEFVDVNVTPAKTDVRFVDNSIVYGTVYSTIEKALDGTDRALEVIVDDEGNSSQVIRDLGDGTKEIIGEDGVKRYESNGFIVSDRFAERNTKYEQDDFKNNFFNSLLRVAEDDKLKLDGEQPAPTPTPVDDVFAENKRYIAELEEKAAQEKSIEPILDELRYIGQVLNTYLIFERGSDVYFIDQHAAHERLLYNKLCYVRSGGEKTVQPLLVPYVLNVAPLERDIIESKIPALRDFGIDIVARNGEYSVTSVPCELLDMDLKEFFDDILSDTTIKRENIPEVLNEKLMQKACKAAIKSGQTLSRSEVDSLMKLLNYDINLKCPHGRPIAVRITRKEIDKWFKRIV